MAKKNTSKANKTAPDNTDADKAPEAETDPNVDQPEESVSKEPSEAAQPEAADSARDDADQTGDDQAQSDDQASETPAEESLPENAGGDQDVAAVADPKDDVEETDEAPSDTTDETPETPSSEPSTPAKVEQVVVKKGGFFAMVFGGIAAGAIGFAAAYYGLTEEPDTSVDLGPKIDELSEAIDLQAQTVDGLATRLDALPAAPDLAPIDGQIAEIAAQAADLGAAVGEAEAALNALTNRIDDIDERLTQVEQQPVTQGASDAAVDAYERELEAAREQIAQQLDEAQQQIAQQREEAQEQIAQQRDALETQRAEIEALIAEAMSTENEAEQAAMEAMRRAAISRVLAAVESGAPFDNALSDLESTGMETPAPLADLSESGAPSATELQESFPDAARRALSASRSAAAQDGETGGFSGFLRSQLGARSLEPREGNDPDAVLSRAEAAVRDGRLSDALSEIEALPDPGQEVLSDWVAKANRRLAAINAAQELSEKVN